MNDNYSELFCDINEELQFNTCGGIGLLSEISVTSTPNGSTINLFFREIFQAKNLPSVTSQGGTIFTGPLGLIQDIFGPK